MSRPISLENFLNQQEANIQFGEKEIFEKTIKVKNTLDQLQSDFIKSCKQNACENDDKFFNVKSIKVNWKDNKESFMHVFINTTQVKKLEQERANRQYQQIMFASLSHELRTPINAFSNSLLLAKLTFEEIKSKLEKYPKVANQIELIYPRLQNYIKIGEVSS